MALVLYAPALAMNQGKLIFIQTSLSINEMIPTTWLTSNGHKYLDTGRFDRSGMRVLHNNRRNEGRYVVGSSKRSNVGLISNEKC